MHLPKKKQKAEIFMEKDGVSTPLGQVDVHRSGGSYRVIIPEQCLENAEGDTFRVSFSGQFLREARFPFLQILHRQFILDVWLRKNITYMVPER